MKEKTFKDLGLDTGEEFLNKIGEEFDIDNLDEILKGEEEDEEEIEKKLKEIKDNI